MYGKKLLILLQILAITGEKNYLTFKIKKIIFYKNVTQYKNAGRSTVCLLACTCHSHTLAGGQAQLDQGQPSLLHF